jgi:hypothetical protein
MAVYAANSNGDWWLVSEDTKIFILDTDDENIKKIMLDEDVEEGGDKFEQFIQENGKDVIAEVKSSLEEDSKTLVEYQEQEEEEDYGDAMTSMDRKEYEGRTDVQAWVLALLTGKAKE